MVYVSSEITKDVLIEVALRKIAEQNPQDMRTIATGQIMIHPGLMLELNRIRSKLQHMDKEEIRGQLAMEAFNFCNG